MIAIDLNINPFASWGLGLMATIVCAQLFLTSMLLGGLAGVTVTILEYL